MNISTFVKKSGMTEAEVNNHLESFVQGSYLVNQYTYNRFIKGQEILGRYMDCDLFISNSEDLDKLLADSKGDIAYIEKTLGLKTGTFGDGPIYRIDVFHPEQNNIRMATGKELGACELFNTTFPEGVDPDSVYKKITPRKKYKYKGKEIPVLKILDKRYQDYIHSDYIDADTNLFHHATLEGYKGLTSGGNREAVIDCVINDRENVVHRVYDSISDPARPGVRLINEKDSETTELHDGFAPEGSDGLTDFRRKEKNFIESIKVRIPDVSDDIINEVKQKIKTIYVRTLKNRRLYEAGGKTDKLKNLDISDIIKLNDSNMPAKARNEIKSLKEGNRNSLENLKGLVNEVRSGMTSKEKTISKGIER